MSGTAHAKRLIEIARHMPDSCAIRNLRGARRSGVVEGIPFRKRGEKCGAEERLPVPSRDTSDPRERVEAGIEAQNLLDPIFFHYCKMHCVTGRELTICQDNLLRALDYRLVNYEDLVNYT